MPARKVSLDNNKESVKKPGLSALMPDKTPKAVAERNRAVKRMFKESPKRASKTTKPVSSTAKPKTATKLEKDKKSVIKKVAKPRIRSVAKNGITIQSKINEQDVILLPDRVSVRSQEKVLAILSTITKDFKHSAERVAYTAGFCFVVFGSYLSLSFSGALPNVLTPQVAQLITGNTSGLTQTVKTTTSQTAIAPRPTFTLHDSLPPVVETVSKHTIEVTNAGLENAAVYSLSTGKKFDIASEKVVDNTFRLTVDPDALDPARYVLKVTLKSTHDDSMYVFKVGEFEVKPDPANVTPSTPVASSSQPSGEPEVEPAETPEEEPELEVPEPEKLTVTTLSNVLSDRTVISVTAPAGARTVELYVRPLKSSTKRFIGLAEKYDNVWRYFFDTEDVPNGEYEIVARSKVDGSYMEASSLRVKIANFTGSPTTPENPTPEDVAAIEPEIEINPENSRSFSEVSLSAVAADTEIADTASSSQFETETDIDSIVAAYKQEIESILQRYAVAKQSEDPLMLELVEREIKEIRNTMVRDVLLDPTLNDLGDDVDAVLEERFSGIKRRIDTFEELRRTATERASAIDRDGDGISDFDEVNLYQTDPDKSDTDNDGVTDGIEVMRGFDPLDPTAEVVVTYEMPQDTVGLIENDLLKIENVSPIVKTTDPTIAPTVQAEIRGKGLPNSFVTIYVFSTPTIVTVRTGEDGSFVYTFEKELEDGEHEVYVAVTDNTGAIMARSNPFKFIKQAEAFSPVGGAGVTPTDNSLTGIQFFGSYNVAIGLGILAFGMILLMLGATLRERQGFIMTSPKNDIATS
jgi:hypothetical protein